MANILPTNICLGALHRRLIKILKSKTLRMQNWKKPHHSQSWQLAMWELLPWQAQTSQFSQLWSCPFPGGCWVLAILNYFIKLSRKYLFIKLCSRGWTDICKTVTARAFSSFFQKKKKQRELHATKQQSQEGDTFWERTNWRAVIGLWSLIS